MVERIEKITPVKGTDYDVRRPFDQKSNTEDNRQKQAFASVLRNSMHKDDIIADTKAEEAYALSLSRATQSLFYKDGSGIASLQGIEHAKG